MSVEARKFSSERLPLWSATLLTSLSEHDQVTYHHSVRVGSISALLWEAIYPVNPTGPPPFVTAEDVYRAGLLHDIKKKDVPSAILNRHEALTPEEMTILAEHPFTSAAEVARYDRKLADIIRGHHRFGKNGVTYQDYATHADAQAAMQRPGYSQIEKAQVVMAIADKADTGVNRIKGVHGKALEEERIELGKRFHEEIEQGHISPLWIDMALQIAWEIGSADMAQ